MPVNRLWKKYKPLIRKGYDALNKEMILIMPGPCMPPVSVVQNTGIGSPYGAGAKRIVDFFGGVFDKIQLGPDGKTNKKTGHSPYMSDSRPNPFFIPLEILSDKGLISSQTLNKIYDIPKTDGQIDFEQVEKSYQAALKEAYKNSRSSLSFDDYVSSLCRIMKKSAPARYIADFQVRIPTDIKEITADMFLKGYSLGAPPDSFSTEYQQWNFPVFHPKLMFNKKGGLGPAGRAWYKIIDTAMTGAEGGLRIDHYIGFVNPFVISDKDVRDSGRLYSSPDHPVLGQFALKKSDDFTRITEKIVLDCAKKHGLTVRDIYTEDVGIRPPQLDGVMEKYGLGRLLITQFNNPDDWRHIYHLIYANPQDVAVVDTHDTPSVQEFFSTLSDEKKYKFAWQLAMDLRFNYNDDLKQVKQLIRMQWGALMASPAERVGAFFTSWTGQTGRYNNPALQGGWKLRCVADFEKLYFKNLVAGWAFNPFDAIALAIYARGDSFYAKHENLVRELRMAEQDILSAANEISE